MFCRKYKEKVDLLNYQIDRMKEIISELKQKSKRADRFENITIQAIEEGYNILGIEENKEGDKVLVYQTYEYDMENDCLSNIQIKNMYKGHMDRFVLNCFYKIRKKDNQIYIQDIIMREQNTSKGYGTIAMKHLKDIAYSKEMDIHGFIAYPDRDHHDRTVHFYKKNGFIVTYDTEKQSGKIVYKVQDSS